MSCGVGRRCSSDPALLWPWCRPEAVAPTGPLAWEPPYDLGVALKSKKKKKEIELPYHPAIWLLGYIHRKQKHSVKHYVIDATPCSQ